MGCRRGLVQRQRNTIGAITTAAAAAAHNHSYIHEGSNGDNYVHTDHSFFWGGSDQESWRSLLTSQYSR